MSDYTGEILRAQVMCDKAILAQAEAHYEAIRPLYEKAEAALEQARAGLARTQALGKQHFDELETRRTPRGR